jgi:microcompartment protein CcmL/EutN
MSVEYDVKQLKSIGVIETFSAASIIDAADAAIKSANVTLLRVHLAMALGGKGFVMFAGDISSVQAAVAAGSQAAAEVRHARLPGRHPQPLSRALPRLHLTPPRSSF